MATGSSPTRTKLALRSVRDGKKTQIVEEYELNTALIESRNSVERRAAIETGQEVDRQDINLHGDDRAEVLKKAFTFEELDAMQARMQAVIDAEQGKSTPPANLIDLEPVLEAGGEGKQPSWRD